MTAPTHVGFQVGVAALKLYDAGLNIFPIQPGSKKPYGPWGMLTTTRLYRETLSSLVIGSNLAVITGRLSGNLFILDADSRDDAAWVKGQLLERRMPYWERNSVRGAQFWFRCAEGEVENSKFRDTQILGHNLYGLAPPSIHTDGVVLEWDVQYGDAPPLVSFEYFDFLPLKLASQRSNPERREKPHVLPSVANQVLIERDISGYRSNSEAEFASVISLIGAGWTDERIDGLFRQIRPTHFLKHKLDHWRSYTLGNARKYAADRDHGALTGHSTLCSAPSYTQWAQSRSWPGRTGRTDRAVYFALCERRRRDGTSPFRASIREVAELAGVNKETAYTSLQRLLQQGLVTAEEADRTCGSHCYSLNTPDTDRSVEAVRQPYTRCSASAPAEDSVRILNTSHDAWCERALGKSAQACYARLLQNHATRKTLAAELGMARTTVKRALERLNQFGLATPIEDDGDQWQGIEVRQERLDEIAALCGSAGTGERRTEKHAEERQKRASTLLMRQIARYNSTTIIPT